MRNNLLIEDLAVPLDQATTAWLWAADQSRYRTQRHDSVNGATRRSQKTRRLSSVIFDSRRKNRATFGGQPADRMHLGWRPGRTRPRLAASPQQHWPRAAITSHAAAPGHVLLSRAWCAAGYECRIAARLRFFGGNYRETPHANTPKRTATGTADIPIVSTSGIATDNVCARPSVPGRMRPSVRIPVQIPGKRCAPTAMAAAMYRTDTGQYPSTPIRLS